MANGNEIVIYVPREEALKLKHADQGARQNGSDRPVTAVQEDCPYARQPWKIWVFATTTEPSLPANLVVGADFDGEEGGEFHVLEKLTGKVATDRITIEGTGIRHGNAGVLPQQGWVQNPKQGPPIELPQDDNRTFEVKIERLPWIEIKVFHRVKGNVTPLTDVKIKLKPPGEDASEKDGPLALFECLKPGLCDVVQLTDEKKFWMAV